MKRSIRLQTRIATKNQMRLRLAAGLGTLAAMLAGIFFLYQFIQDTRELKAAKLLELSKEGRNKLEGYSNRNKLSLNHFIIGGLNPAAPLLINIKSDELQGIAYGGNVVHPSGEDIVLTASDGSTPLAFSIERYDPSIGKLLAWVYPDETLLAEEPSLFLYCGNTLEAQVEHNPAELPFYNAIWHFNGNFNNSGSKALVGEYKGIKDEEGRFGGAKEFLSIEKGAAAFEPSETLKFSGDISISVWVKPYSLSGEQVLFSNQWFNGGCRLYINETGQIGFEITGHNGRMASLTLDKNKKKIEVGKWSQVVASYSRKNEEISTYLNGKSYGKQKVKPVYNAGKWIVLGAEPNLKSGFYNGLMDELRVCNAALSPEQISRTWAIENQAETLFKLDGQEVFSGSPGLWAIAQFEAQANGDHVTVHWTTTHESNLDFFALERSNDGTHFTKVATCFAKGNSETNQNYFLNDAAPITGNTYYRLRAVNFRKESNVSNTVSVYFKTAEASLHISKVEPNPFSNDFDVVFGSNRKDPLEIRLTSISGNVVYREKIDGGLQSEHRFKFKDQQNLKPGIYFFSVHQNNDQKTIKLVKRVKDA
jgi:hypothetical protein